MPLIEALQFPFRHFHQGFHHGVMPLAVLQGETVFSIDFILFKKPVIGQFFAAQTNQHDFSTKVRVTDKVPHSTNGNDGKGALIATHSHKDGSRQQRRQREGIWAKVPV